MIFRPLRREDFPLLQAWLAEPLVARWWSHETSPEALERDFGPAIDGRDAAEVFIAAAARGGPFGLIQRYRLDDEPAHRDALARLCTVPAGALSIDYLIGDPERRGGGLGTAMIAAFVARCWTDDPSAALVLVPVHVQNTRSWRALERAGFARVGAGELEPDNAIDSRDHYVLACKRPTATPAPPK